MLTVNTALLTLYGFVSQGTSSLVWHIAVPIAGILASLVWWLLLRSYRDLNTVKFKVIRELETSLPAKLYDYEWQLAEEGRGKTYRPLSWLESWVPLIFTFTYLLLGIAQAVGAVM